MFKLLRNTHIPVLFLSVLALLLQTLFIVSPQQVFALTTQEQQRCYNTFDGKDIIYTELSTSEQSLFNQCRSDGTCKDAGEGSTIGSRKISCTLPSNASDPGAVSTASDAEAAPIVKYFCGSAPADTASGTYLRYNDCKNDVRTAYAKCKYTGGSITSSLVDTPENIAKCLYTSLKAYKPGVKPADAIKAVGNAIVEGQKESSKILASASNKSACEKVGGSWDPSQATPCVQGTPDTTDECPLPDDTSMRWLGCSIMSVVQVATDKLYGAIQNFLYTPTSMIFDNPALKKASDGIRNIAIGLILIAGLVMVIAQATGSDLFDAYTLRKLIPRIGVAVIGIALAWPLLRFAITFTNDIGLLADRLLVGVTQLGVNGGGSQNEVGTNILSTLFAAGAAGGAVLVLGAAGLISLAGTILLAMLLGLLVLAIRQLVIMVCVLLAPLAIAAYVLPGTQKLWSFWKSTLITTLLMFPIIMFFLASGKAFATILGGANTGTMSLLAIIVFIAPYFLLPFAFKLAGGLMSTIFSIANDKNRGMFDRLKKGRQQAVSKNWEGMREGNRFRGSNAFSTRANRVLEGATNVDKAGFNPLQMRSKMRTALNDNSHDEASEFLEKNHSMGAIKGDDAKLAGARYTNRQEIEQELARFDSSRFGGASNTRARTDAATQIMRAQREVSGETFQRARTRAMASTGTGYQDPTTGQLNLDQMLTDINAAYGNDRNGAGRALAEMRGALTNSGQIAGQAGFGTWAGALESRYNGTMSAQQAHNTIMDDAINSASPGNAVYGKPSSAAAMGTAHARRIQAISNGIQAGTHTQEDLDAATAGAAGILDAMGQASPANASAFANSMMGVTIAGTSGTFTRTQKHEVVDPATGNVSIDYTPQTVTVETDQTVRDLIDNRMSNEEYRNRRRDYGSQALGEAQLLQQRAAQASQGQVGNQPPQIPGNRPPGS